MSRWWWEHISIDLEGAKKREAETMTISKLESEEESYVEANKDSGGEEESQGERGSSESEWSGVEE